MYEKSGPIVEFLLPSVRWLCTDAVSRVREPLEPSRDSEAKALLVRRAEGLLSDRKCDSESSVTPVVKLRSVYVIVLLRREPGLLAGARGALRVRPSAFAVTAGLLSCKKWDSGVST